ncbi:hypothetical protein AOLI_G00041170, partial [Acnodon oligacanthus]
LNSVTEGRRAGESRSSRVGVEVVLLLCSRRFDGQRRDDAVNAGQEDKLHDQGDQIPAQDEATAHNVRGQGHDLAHSQRRQDVGHLIDPPHGGVHP